jgi:hypothetical protein
MAYYTQDATCGADVNRFYGEQGAHNHDKANAFSPAIKEIMKATYGQQAHIELGHFASNQSTTPLGGRRVVELKWKNGSWGNA